MKKLLALLLAVLMVLSLSSVVAEEEIVKLTWAQGTASNAPTDNAMVVEKLNEISREKIGVECDILYFTNDEILLSIQSGEVFDMYFTCSWYNNFNDAVSNGLFVNLDPYIKEYAPDLYATMSEDVWDLARSTDGGLYAIPVKKDYAVEQFVCYPAQIARDFAASEGGYEIPESITDWDELTDFLVWWKEHNADYNNECQYPVTLSSNIACTYMSFDFIDRSIGLGVLFGDEDAVVRPLIDDPDTVKRWEVLYKWNSLGLINPDAATTTENAITPDATHIHLTFPQAWDHYDPSAGNGYECGMTRYLGPLLSTEGVQGSMNAISITLEEDLPRLQKCLEYQQLVNTDQLFRDTLRYGVQGYHWDYVTEGPCAGAVKKTSQGDYAPWAFSQGNYELSSIEVSEDQVNGTVAAPDLDQWAYYYSVVDSSAQISTICGFTLNTSNIQAEIAQVAAIQDEFLTQLGTGTGEDPTTLIPKFREALDDAGMQTIIAETQAQLNAYLGK